MRAKKGIYLIISILIFSFLGCDKNIENKDIKNIIIPEMGRISLYSYNNDIYKLYSITNDGMKKIDIDGVKVYGNYNDVLLFSINNDNTEKLYYKNENEINEFPKFEGELKSNPSKTKVLYKKSNNNGDIELFYFDFQDNKEYKVSSEILFSGDNYIWKNDDAIIIYGLKNENNNYVNGLFSYNLKSRKEEVLIPIKEGFIEYIKVINNKLYYLIEENNKCLKVYDMESDEDKELVDEIYNVVDIEETKDELYILGSIREGKNQIYIEKDNKLSQVTYDFPKNIDLENKIKVDDNGNILFIGYDESINEKEIYCKIANSKTIKIISEGSSNYYFIED